MWTEWNRETIATPAMASVPEALTHNLGAKRQRRPSVRLGEIGDLPAAIIPDAYLKRKKVSGTYAGEGDNVRSSEGNGTIDSSATHAKTAAKAMKTCPLLHVNNGSLHQRDSSDDDGHFKPADPVSSYSLVPAENQSGLPSAASQGGNRGRQMQHLTKTGNRKAGNGKRRRGPRGLAPFQKLTKTVASVIEIDDNDYEKVCAMDDTSDPHSEAAYDAHTPEGFRDCNLEVSDYSKDDKEMSTSQEVEPPDADTLIRASLNYQPPEYRAQQFETTRTHTLEQQQESIDRSEDRGGSASNRFGMMSNKGGAHETRPDADGKPLTEVKARPVHEGRSKLTLEGDRILENRDFTLADVEKQFKVSQPTVRLPSSLVNGVRGWLQGLGLDKYAPLFETHEVDTEVLPLLTLDDLKDMGVTAVGTRRKMFYAIRQLGMDLMGRADSF